MNFLPLQISGLMRLILFFFFLQKPHQKTQRIEEKFFMVCKSHSSRSYKVITKFNKSLGNLTIQKEIANVAHVVSQQQTVEWQTRPFLAEDFSQLFSTQTPREKH